MLRENIAFLSGCCPPCSLCSDVIFSGFQTHQQILIRGRYIFQLVLGQLVENSIYCRKFVSVRVAVFINIGIGTCSGKSVINCLYILCPGVLCLCALRSCTAACSAAVSCALGSICACGTACGKSQGKDSCQCQYCCF